MAQSRRFSLSKLPIASSAIVLALALTGCQASGAEEPTTTPEASNSASSSPSASASATPTPATPEPTPASSSGPAANIPVPEKPALADKNTKAGLEAFTKWWFELFSYGYATNNWKPFDSVTDSGCKTCANVVAGVKEHYQSGGWVVGGGASVSNFSTKFEQSTTGSINSFVTVRQNAITKYAKDGGVIGKSPATESSLDVVIAVHAGDHWVMLDFGAPGGT
ncbi:DUF6318 family protein [Arthrobacter pigmenti]